MRYGERTARGVAAGEATLEERRRAKSNKRIIVSRNIIRLERLRCLDRQRHQAKKTIRGGNDHSASGVGKLLGSGQAMKHLEGWYGKSPMIKQDEPLARGSAER